jgi:hypothetical protein
VYGEQTSKELIAFLAEHSGALDTLDKMRLFLCYLATHPEKLDATKHSQWAKLARLSAHDMNTVCNLAYLGVAVMKTGGRRRRAAPACLPACPPACLPACLPACPPLGDAAAAAGLVQLPGAGGLAPAPAAAAPAAATWRPARPALTAPPPAPRPPRARPAQASRPPA